MEGGFCSNEWLVREGYLALKEQPASVEKLDPRNVDSTRTKAWGDGGYYGRLFLNVRGREPDGTVPPEAVPDLKRELMAKLEALTDEGGRPLGTRVFAPEDAYAAGRNVPPDLIVYFGDLAWRSVGSIGHESVWTHDNDTGPDDANHARFGVFLMARVADIRAAAASGASPGTGVRGSPSMMWRRRSSTRSGSPRRRAWAGMRCGSAARLRSNRRTRRRRRPSSRAASRYSAIYDRGRRRATAPAERIYRPMWTETQLTDDLRILGLEEGDAVLVHTSLRAVGPMEAGAETLMRAFRSVLGTSGTLLGADSPFADRTCRRAARRPLRRTSMWSGLPFRFSTRRPRRLTFPGWGLHRDRAPPAGRGPVPTIPSSLSRRSAPMPAF